MEDHHARRCAMRSMINVVLTGAAFLSAVGPGLAAEPPRLAQATGTAPTVQKMPGKAAAAAVKLRGTVEAVDKEKKTVTLKGPKGNTVTLDVQDPAKLDAVKVGDPVVAVYYESIAIQARKAGEAAPSATVETGRAGSKPGETPAGAMARQVTVTGKIKAIDKAKQTVTIEGPQGNTETIKVKDPKNIQGVRVGDLVDFTFTQALAVSLDKSPSPAKK
jgi:Cu/Ag efflux protein CusF